MRDVLAAVLLGIVLVGTSQAQIDLQMTKVSDLPTVVEIKNAGDGSNRLFLLQQTGAINVIENGQLLPEPFMDIRSLITVGNEQGLLSMAFSPDFANNGEFYLYFTDTQERSNIGRFRLASGNPNQGDISSEQTVFTAIQPLPNHNGGRLEFGPDGYLYLGIGDGGGANDQLESGQDLTTVLGSIIRIDVESGVTTYSIPPDNPFVNQGGGVRGEIWASGLRNPWRMAFDRDTGDLYIADVGQQNLEEINVQPASSPGGENYGWNTFEGNNCFDSSSGCSMAGLTFPVFEYSHSDGNCSITGGQVYRGPDYPALDGVYLYGDFCTGLVWGLSRSGQQWNNQLLLDTGLSQLFTFGEDERGNVYMAGSAGFGDSGIWLLSDGPPVEVETGIAIEGSLSGTWVVDGLNDQGFFVTVDENASGPFLFVAWFTFDEQGNQRWLVGLAFFESGDTSVELEMQEVSGLEFLDFSDLTADRTVFGTMNFHAVDCDTIEADYDFGMNGVGSMVVTRLTAIQGLACQ